MRTGQWSQYDGAQDYYRGAADKVIKGRGITDAYAGSCDLCKGKFLAIGSGADELNLSTMNEYSETINKAAKDAIVKDLIAVGRSLGFLKNETSTDDHVVMKTFLKDGDVHTPRLLEEFPGKETGTYIHPVMGVAEFVYSEEELVNFLEERFIVRKVYRSHKHAFKGRARKRRTISIYAEKDY